VGRDLGSAGRVACVGPALLADPCAHEKWDCTPGLTGTVPGLQEPHRRRSLREHRASHHGTREPWGARPTSVGSGTGAVAVEQTHLAPSSAPPTAEG